jgi:hypothetical protein
MCTVSVAGEVALSIFSNKTTTPSPLPLPEGRGSYKDKAAMERITEDKTHKAIGAKPKFQQVNEGDG